MRRRGGAGARDVGNDAHPGVVLKTRLERAKEKVGSEADLLHFESLTDHGWKSVMVEQCGRDKRGVRLFAISRGIEWN
jgi:hypothetical protein